MDCQIIINYIWRCLKKVIYENYYSKFLKSTFFYLIYIRLKFKRLVVLVLDRQRQ